MMSRRSSKKLKFSPEHKRLLRSLTIDESGPGTILHDFDALLAFIGRQELTVTPMHQLPRRTLPEINARLARPLQLGLKKPLQKSYPHIHGLYLLVRASGLTCVEGTSRKPLLAVDDVVHRAWEGLNPTEQYCTLLETWLLRGFPEIIGERGRFGARVPDTFIEWQWFFLRIPDEGMPVAGDKEVEDVLRYMLGWHNLGLLELFGLISVRHGPPEPGKGWRIERIDRAPLGDALLALLRAGFFGDIGDVLQLEAEEKVPFGVLQPALQPYLPEWRNNLSVPEWAFREGTHVFKVSWGRMWRRIAIPAGHTLDALASAILNAIAFSHDHLYEFTYQNRFGVLERVSHPYVEEGPWTRDVLVGDVPLRVGQTMTYVFDFGDWWEFDVTLERVDPGMAIEKPVVLEKHGEPPEQYR
jgi:hypothetical protein